MKCSFLIWTSFIWFRLVNWSMADSIHKGNQAVHFIIRKKWFTEVKQNNVNHQLILNSIPYIYNCWLSFSSIYLYTINSAVRLLIVYFALINYEKRIHVIVQSANPFFISSYLYCVHALNCVLPHKYHLIRIKKI